MPGCCKAATIYGWGRSHDYPGEPSADQLTRSLRQQLEAIRHGDYYGVVTVFLIESQREVAEPVLRRFGFRKVLDGEGNKAQVRVYLYALSVDRLDAILARTKPKKATTKSVANPHKVLA